MILRGARVALNSTCAERVDLTIRQGRVHFGTCGGAGPVLDLEGFLILPGLINAHDHLEFNLFPRLGSGPYSSAAAWASDIYHPGLSPVREQLLIPKSVRLTWGGIKNLAAGVTSVLHHNPYDGAVFGEGFPIRVIQAFGWAHSLRYSPDLRERHAATPPGVPFILHAGEGTDAESRGEIDQLDAAGVLGPSTVIVHAVALDGAGISLAKKRGASLVWCPSSNYFTLGRSLSRDVLESGIPVALGTDSALTCAGDLIDEIETARAWVEADRLYQMVTSGAAAILRLNSGAGAICEFGLADLVLVRDSGQTPAKALRGMRPQLVLIGGRVKLVSLPVAAGLAGLHLSHLQPLEIENRGSFLIDCNLPRAIEPVRQIVGDHFCLAGKRVVA